jgi:hypothetical protein
MNKLDAHLYKYLVDAICMPFHNVIFVDFFLWDSFSTLLALHPMRIYFQKPVYFSVFLIGLACMGVSFYLTLSSKQEMRTIIQVTESFVLSWIGILLTRKSLSKSSEQESPLQRHQYERRKLISSSTCPKPYTPSSHIHVVDAHLRREKPATQGRRNSKIQHKQISRRVPPQVSETSSIINYNNESFISTECSGDTPVAGDISITSPTWKVPDSIAAIWEPLDNSPPVQSNPAGQDIW